MLNKLQGMFSFVIWDIQKRGICSKLAWNSTIVHRFQFNGIVLASQVKTILSTNLVSKEKDLNSELSFFHFWFCGRAKNNLKI